MSTAVAEILARAKQLSREEKSDLTYALFEEFENELAPSKEIDEAWFAEVKRREIAALKGNSKSTSWAELKAKIETR